jgi:catechol 2,3-dioxygenase-like lactoylglutathione lyase family enzyme
VEQRISVVTLGVADINRSRQFYEQGLGWTTGAAEGQIVFFQLNGLIFALYPRNSLAEDAQLPSNGTGFTGVTLEVP